MDFSSSWSSLTAQESTPKDSDYFARLSAFLAQNPVPGSLAPDSLFSPDVIAVPPAQLSAMQEGASSPEGSSASSEPLEVHNGKRKSSGDSLSRTNSTKALKDKRISTKEAAHTHEEGVISAAGSKKKTNTTSEKRKEQNRNAQRAFRERREKHAKDLEGRVEALEEAAKEREQENANLKELVSRLQQENARLNATAKFDFTVPATAAGQKSMPGLAPNFLSNTSMLPFMPQAPVLQKQKSSSSGSSPEAGLLDPYTSTQPYFNLGNSIAPLTPPRSESTASSLLGDANDLFGEPTDLFDSRNSLFTPSGEHLNPLSSLDSWLTSPTVPVDSALSPGSTEALFMAYRDPTESFSKSLVSPPLTTPELSSSDSKPASTKEPSPPLVIPASIEKSGMKVTTEKCEVFRNNVKSLRGAEAFDIDSLCNDMMRKATCQTAACHALEEAVATDMDVNTFFDKIGASSEMKHIYHR